MTVRITLLNSSGFSAPSAYEDPEDKFKITSAYEGIDNFSIDIKGTVFTNIVYSYSGSTLILNGSEHTYGIPQSGIRIFSTNINNASLVNQSFNSDTEGFLSVNLSYRAYLMN